MTCPTKAHCGEGLFPRWWCYWNHETDNLVDVLIHPGLQDWIKAGSMSRDVPLKLISGPQNFPLPVLPGWCELKGLASPTMLFCCGALPLHQFRSSGVRGPWAGNWNGESKLIIPPLRWFSEVLCDSDENWLARRGRDAGKEQEWKEGEDAGEGVEDEERTLSSTVWGCHVGVFRPSRRLRM